MGHEGRAVPQERRRTHLDPHHHPRRRGQRARRDRRPAEARRSDLDSAQGADPGTERDSVHPQAGQDRAGYREGHGRAPAAAARRRNPRFRTWSSKSSAMSRSPGFRVRRHSNTRRRGHDRNETATQQKPKPSRTNGTSAPRPKRSPNRSTTSTWAAASSSARPRSTKRSPAHSRAPLPTPGWPASRTNPTSAPWTTTCSSSTSGPRSSARPRRRIYYAASSSVGTALPT